MKRRGRHRGQLRRPVGARQRRPDGPRALAGDESPQHGGPRGLCLPATARSTRSAVSGDGVRSALLLALDARVTWWHREPQDVGERAGVAVGDLAGQPREPPASAPARATRPCGAGRARPTCSVSSARSMRKPSTSRPANRTLTRDPGTATSSRRPGRGSRTAGRGVPAEGRRRPCATGLTAATASVGFGPPGSDLAFQQGQLLGGRGLLTHALSQPGRSDTPAGSDAGGGPQGVDAVGALPGELGQLAPEVAIRRSEA